MGAFDRARKILPLGNRRKSSQGGGDLDFDFDELEEMGGEFGDDHDVKQDRKSSIKSYIKDHYSSKLNDSNERKRLLKSSLPASYSGTIDLASDLKDDFDSIRYDLNKEWQKQSGSLKKVVKSFESQLKFLRMNKLVDWGNSSSGRGSYQEDEVSQGDALVASMMGDFPGLSRDPKVMRERQKEQIRDKEEVSEYRSKTLSAALRGTVSSEQTATELRKLTNYQDQVTYVYQKKSLEVQIRSYVEHKTQTELLRTYKDEAVAELKEIHKNTGLPEAVKINQNEFASQIFKEKMMGNVANWFNGNTAAVRKRVTARIRTQLTEMTRNFGSTLDNFIGMSGADDEQGGGGIAKMFMNMGSDWMLDQPYNRATDSITGRLRNKLMGNRRINKFGKGMQSVVSGMGGSVNHALLTGESGNGIVNSLMDFLGLRQAAVTRNDKVQGSLRENLDTAAFMDVKFKQTVERVIPGWLKLIHKENHLIRLGQKDDKNYKSVDWDWDKEKFSSTDEIRQRAMSKVFNRDRVIETAEAYDELMNAFGAFGLPATAQEKLRDWLRKRVTSSMPVSPFYLYIERESVFGKDDAVAFEQLADFLGHLGNIDEDLIDVGAINEGVLRYNNHKYGAWAMKVDAAYKRASGVDVFDRAELQRLYSQGMGHFFDEMGATVRNDDGSVSISSDFADGIFKKYGRKKLTQNMHFKDGETRTVGKGTRSKSVMGYEIDESKTDADWEDRLNDEYHLEDNDSNRNMNRWLTDDVISDRNNRANKSALSRLLDAMDLMSSTEAGQRGLLDRFTRASGGYIPSFAKGGPTGDNLNVDDEIHAKLHGKEFITDKETTEKNRKLLEFMNKFKAPVVMPDGSVNPIYYKAFGYKTEEEFKESDMDTSLSREQTNFFKSIRNAGNNEEGYKLIAELFTSLDLNRISDKDLNMLISKRVPMDKKFKLFLDIRKKQSKKKTSTSDVLGNGLQRLRNGLEGAGKEGEAIEKAKSSMKSFFEKAKAEVLKMSDEQADMFVNKALATLDADTLNENQMETLTDPAVSPKDKALLIAKLSLRRDDKVKVAKQAILAGIKSVKTNFRTKLKTMINGGTESTKNTDNLKAIRDIAGGHANRGKDYVKSKVDIIRQLAEGGQLDEKAKEYANKVLTKLRMDKVAGVGLKLWKDKPIDIYLADDLSFPRLNALAFANGAYIDFETGRVLETHHDITGPVIDKNNEFVLTAADFTKGLVDKEGNPIFINSLKRYRNQAKQKAAELYNKYAKKHVDKGIDKFLTLSEKWQSLFKRTDIDLYIGEGQEPRLTAAGFRDGKYLSVLKKKPLKGYIDIDGPVMLADGTIIVATEELQNSPFRDKEGNTIRPPKLMSNMGRLGALVWNALSFDKAYNVGKKALGKLKNAWKKWKDKRKKNEEDEDGEQSPIQGTEPGKRYGQKLKEKFKKYAGYEDNDEGGKTLRIGSWQWKRKKREDDGWFSRFSGLFNRGDKEKEGKKKGILGKLLGVVGSIAGGLFTIGNKIGSIISGSVMGVAKWLVPKLAVNAFKVVGWLAKPLLSSLAFIGRGVAAQAMGRGIGIGTMAKGVGLAAGGYMMYNGLKGQEKLDENGQPVIGEDGKPVTETDWTTTALGAGTMAASMAGRGTLTALGRGAMALGSVARIGAGILSGPVGWAMLGATAAYYGGKWAMGYWKKGKAAEENPFLSFRINQYGFDMTDEKSMSSLLQLESVLQPNLVIQGEKANFKSELDVESVFGVFGLKYEGGDPERNKKFLTWFLGRFKPVYLAYIRSVNALKKTTDLNDLDKKLSVADRITLLDKVHFKNQTDMNPYNIKVSPFEDPDETNYDFEDMEDRYEKTKSILDEKLPAEAKAADAKAADPNAKPEEEKSAVDTVTTGLKYAGLAGGLIGGSIWALKKLSQGAGDIFNKTVEGMGKNIGSMIDGMMAQVSAGWDKVKSFGSSIGGAVGGAVGAAGEAVGNAVDTVTNTVSNAASDTWEGIKETATNFFGGGKKSADIAKVIEVGKGYNVVETKDGSMIKQTGAWNWRNNNPGNISDGDWARKHGAIDQGKVAAKGSGRFAVFPTYAVGRQAKAALIFNGINYKNLDLMAAIARYAPPHENNTANYQRTVLAAVGSNKLMKDYTNEERIKILNAMEKLEGLKAGSVQVIKKGTGPVGNASESKGVLMSDAGKTNAPSAVKNMANGVVTNATAKVATPAAAAGSKSTATAGSAKAPAGSPATSAQAATPTATKQVGGALGGFLAKATEDLVALGKTHFSLNTAGKSPVTLQGMNETFMRLFYAMIGEAKKKGLAKILITEGTRTLAEQKRLYALFLAKKGPLAAKPGRSLHGFGHAMDINTPNADQLDRSGLLAKYGFSRPLMRRKKNGQMTETWHIENKSIPRNGKTPSYPAMNDPKPVSVTSSSPSTDGVTYQSANGKISSSPGGSSNAAIAGVMGSGGYSSTSNVSTAQRSDSASMVATNNILSQQLKVQTQIKDTLLEIKNFMIKPQTEIDQLKKKQANSPENIGNMIGTGVAEAIATKFGLGNPNEKPKPTAVISASK